MNKIPTLYQRDPDDRRRVLPEVTPGCEWVLRGEGVPTRKYDGTCVMFDGARWWARREVRPGKTAPADFRALSTDEITGKTVGWEPIEQSPFIKFFVEAQAQATGDMWAEGTYELCGPKINGNPEGYADHMLIRHADAARLPLTPRETSTFEGIVDYLRGAPADFEGIVWHHPDGRMAKLKVRDVA